jgi:hypothetical protein
MLAHEVEKAEENKRAVLPDTLLTTIITLPPKKRGEDTTNQRGNFRKINFKANFLMEIPLKNTLFWAKIANCKGMIFTTHSISTYCILQFTA